MNILFPYCINFNLNMYKNRPIPELFDVPYSTIPRIKISPLYY
ncbi:hypothetical protein [Klebsiella phage 05F01]|nr:hypothetical protein [Klebsiella phage 05F01]